MHGLQRFPHLPVPARSNELILSLKEAETKDAILFDLGGHNRILERRRRNPRAGARLITLTGGHHRPQDQPPYLGERRGLDAVAIPVEDALIPTNAIPTFYHLLNKISPELEPSIDASLLMSNKRRLHLKTRRPDDDPEAPANRSTRRKLSPHPAPSPLAVAFFSASEKNDMEALPPPFMSPLHSSSKLDDELAENVRQMAKLQDVIRVQLDQGHSSYKKAKMAIRRQRKVKWTFGSLIFFFFHFSCGGGG